MSTKAVNSLRKCALLELPIEIRLLIYEHVQQTFVLQTKLIAKIPMPGLFGEYCSPRMDSMTVVGSPSALKSTCSTIRNEYSRFCTARNTVILTFTCEKISLHNLGPLENWFEAWEVPATLMAMIGQTTTLRLNVKSGDVHAAIWDHGFFGEFPKLTHLEINATYDEKFYRQPCWRRHNCKCETSKRMLISPASMAKITSLLPDLIITEHYSVVPSASAESSDSESSDSD